MSTAVSGASGVFVIIIGAAMVLVGVVLSLAHPLTVTRFEARPISDFGTSIAIEDPTGIYLTAVNVPWAVDGKKLVRTEHGAYRWVPLEDNEK